MHKVNCPNYLTDVALLFNIISFINKFPSENNPFRGTSRTFALRINLIVITKLW